MSAPRIRGVRRVSILAVLAVTLALPATAQQTAEPTIYELLPAGPDYPIM